MSALAPFVVAKNGGMQALPPRAFSVSSTRPKLVERPDPVRRSKIWEFNTNLHCSIIGTCLSTGELRQVLRKLGVAGPDSTDHELHGTAVTLANRHDKAAKLINKALDERHRLTINQFARAGDEDALRGLWRDAVRRGEIPGAYWATLTHPAATAAIIREAFGEVHMLSHLVGAANRADIRRLSSLEAENAELRARLDRQQVALRDAVVSRDACIADLRAALARKLAAEPEVPAGDTDVLRQLVADLQRRLSAETARSARLAEKLEAANAQAANERSARIAAEHDCGMLRRELAAIEASLPHDEKAPEQRLDGMTLLYVGGRPNQVTHLRDAAEHAGAAFLHHDGGIENQLNLLAGLTSQADIVLFPVDCISHHAAHAVKLLCRQAGKRFVPLRSASVTSLLATLRGPELAGIADAAD